MQCRDSKISVWVCREEKLVFGLSKRTTCADVVEALLDHRDAHRGILATPGGSTSYCILEKWRGCKRVLPNQTKILRLWDSWGEEQKNVKFVLMKSEASLERYEARIAEARVVVSKQSQGVSKSPMSSTSAEKKRRIVRKAFRKLEKMNKERVQAEHGDASSAEKMESLVHLVVSQDHAIQQQTQRIRELDLEIERCETKVHSDRIKVHGVNYVQDTYLFGASDNSAERGDKQLPADTLANYERYVRQCEEIVRLQGELCRQQGRTEHVLRQIQEELNCRWMTWRRSEMWGRNAEPLSQVGTSTEDGLVLERDRIKTEYDISSYIGMRLGADLEAVWGDLKVTEEICRLREVEMRDLMEKMSNLDARERPGDEDRYGEREKGTVCPWESDTEWMEQARGLFKSHSIDPTDEDSDTGLSSLHSQDSDSQAVCQSLV